MQIIILVAGLGSRLGIGNSKPLTRLSSGETLLGRQLELISSSPILSQGRITLVVGFKQELYADAYPELRRLVNYRYETTNTAKSLLVGLSNITNEPILWFNGDLFYDSKVITHLEKVVSKEKSTIFVKSQKSYLDEEAMKISLSLFPLCKRITAISKNLRNKKIEAVGINFIASKDLISFKEMLEKVPDEAYFEQAMELGLREKIFKLRVYDLGENFIAEVDFMKDLLEVDNYLTQKKQ
jgi:choline kinase